MGPMHCDLCGSPTPSDDLHLMHLFKGAIGASEAITARLFGRWPNAVEYHLCSECRLRLENLFSEVKRQVLRHGINFKRA